LPQLRNVKAVNKVAAEHHASRLKRARDNIPPLVGSWGPGKGLPLSPRRPGSPTAASSGSPRFPTHSQSLASIGSFRSASWRSPREFEWEPHGPSVSDEYAATTISRAIHVWERKTAVQQPVWYDSDLPPREPQIENDPYRPPTRPQTPMGSVGGSTVVDPLTSSLRPLTASGSLDRLERLQKSPAAAKRGTDRHPEHPYVKPPIETQHKQAIARLKKRAPQLAHFHEHCLNQGLARGLNVIINSPTRSPRARSPSRPPPELSLAAEASNELPPTSPGKVYTPYNVTYLKSWGGDK